MTESKELTIIEEGTKETIELITKSFQPFIESAKELKKQALEISVKDETDNEGMKKARDLRLSAVKTRKAAEAKKDELKKDALAYGRAVQANYNMLNDFFKSHENDLKNLEETAKRAEEERIQKLIETRTLAIREIDPCIRADYYPLDKLTNEEFNELLNTMALAIKKKEEDRLEAERKEKERKEAEEKAKREAEEKRKAEEERIRKENESLQKKLESERKQREAEEAKRKEEEAKRLEKERIEREKREAEESKKRAELEKKLEDERKERERIQKENEERQKKERERLLAEEKEKQKILQGNDKIKLESYIDQLKKSAVVDFECSSDKGKTMIEWAMKNVISIIDNLERGLSDIA